MPALIPVVAYYGLTALGVGTLLAGGISLASTIAYGDRQRRKANRAAQAAWEASLRDRAVLVRSAELPRSITYGRVKISGELVYGKSLGALQDRLLLVIALRPGHEIDAIEEVFFGERSLGTLDGNGYPTTGPFVTTRADVSEGENSTASGNATTVVTLPYTPVSLASITAQYATGSSGGDNGPAYEALTVASLAGNNVTINTVNPITSAVLAAGTPITVQYLRSQTSASWIRCKTYLGTATQAADADAITDSGGEWTSNHRGRGVPALYVWLQYNADVFPSGVENISAVVRGKKVYDPRTGLTVYSRNPALIARDYLTSPLGFGCPDSEIDDTLVSAAANICDEQVMLQPDPFVWQLRYTCDCDLSTEAPRDENLQVILASMAGSAVYSQGKWRIHAGAYTAPAVTLDETALAGTEAITIQSRVQRSQLFNAVKGVFVSPENKWAPADYPIVTNSTYETQDGGERMVADLTLPATTNGWMAQRLAKIELERSRQALTVRAAFNLKAYRVQAGDTIGLTIARYGFSNKAFRVIDREFDFARGVVLTLREDASGVYAWNSGEATEVDLAPNTTLPSAFSAPTMNAITLASGNTHTLFNGDGTRSPRLYVSWSALTEPQVTQGGAIEVEWRDLPAGAWFRLQPLAGDASSVYIAPVTDGGIYQVRARARNGVGVRSEWKYAAPVVASGAGYRVGGESLNPDPLFRDALFWTPDAGSWYFEDNNGSNSPYLMGCARSVTLWSGIYTGSGSKYVVSPQVPFSGAGQTLRLRARTLNQANQDLLLEVQYFSVSAYISSTVLTVLAGAGVGSVSTQGTVPAGTASIKFVIRNVGGSAFSGTMAVSELRVDIAADTGDIVPGAVTINQQSTPADGQHTQANFTAPAAMAATQIGTLSYTNSTGLSVDLRGQWSVLAMGSGGGGVAGAYPIVYCSVVKNGVQVKQYTLRSSRNGTDWAPLSGQHQLTLAAGESGSITLSAAFQYVTSGAGVGGTIDWRDANLVLVTDRR